MNAATWSQTDTDTSLGRVSSLFFLASTYTGLDHRNTSGGFHESHPEWLNVDNESDVFIPCPVTKAEQCHDDSSRQHDTLE